MRLFVLVCALLWTVVVVAQIPTYYSNVNLNATGATLRSRLATKTINAQNRSVSYTPGVWNALRVTDLNPGSTRNVLLIYGYNDNDGRNNSDRTRSKYDNGGRTGDWNREHVYPKSLGNPYLGTSGPGADLHHLRASDKDQNIRRGSRKFANGSGNSSYITSSGYWYPGDEHKGDVARIIMYMYLRYGNRCLPRNVGTGSTVSNDRNMLQLFLRWNADDPVSAFEIQRNNVIERYQGNRNPFIDNPAFATQIWGGPQAQDRFGNGGGTGGGTVGTTDVTVRITFDNYPGETSWKIVDGNNQVVHTGNGYGRQTSGSTLSVTRTLNDGCYTFVFEDSYGDGICCTNGNGSYALINNSTNNFITSGSSFTFQRTKSFCVGNGRSAPSLTETTAIASNTPLDVALYPNPVQHTVFLKSKQPHAWDYQVLNQMGQVVQQGRVQSQHIDVETLPEGVYQLLLDDGEARKLQTFVKQ